VKGEQSDRVPEVVDAIVAVGEAMKTAGEVGEILDGPTPKGSSGEPTTALEIFVGDQATVSALTPLVPGGRIDVEDLDVACRITAWGGETTGYTVFRTQIRDVLKHLRDRLKADPKLGGIVDRARIGTSPMVWADASDAEGSAVTLEFTVSTKATV
jgi:hypothetical protein